jgi:hypothetical protein
MIEGQPNQVDHFVHIHQDTFGRKAKDSKASVIHPFVANLIFGLSEQMAKSIDFNNQLGLMAIEVGDERTDRVLTTKLSPVEAGGAKMIPKQPLRWSHCPPELE